jgi:quercetin dioxygenase-like cupin family protein
MAIHHATPGEIVDVRSLAGDLKHTASTTIVKADQLQDFRYVLLKDKVFAEHSVPGAITVQCLEGVVEFTAAGQKQLLRTGRLVYLGEGTPHTLKGVEDASVLVTIVAAAQRNPASA